MLIWYTNLFILVHTLFPLHTNSISLPPTGLSGFDHSNSNPPEIQDTIIYRHGDRVQGEPIRIYEIYGLQQCGRMCRQTPGCVRFNHDRWTLNCELHGSSAGVQLFIPTEHYTCGTLTAREVSL